MTEYTLPAGTKAWSEQWAQAFFEHLDVNELKRPVERALTLELPGGLWTALLDADVDDWCLTKYQASAEKKEYADFRNVQSGRCGDLLCHSVESDNDCGETGRVAGT